MDLNLQLLFTHLNFRCPYPDVLGAQVTCMTGEPLTIDLQCKEKNKNRSGYYRFKLEYGKWKEVQE